MGRPSPIITVINPAAYSWEQVSFLALKDVRDFLILMVTFTAVWWVVY